MARTEPGIYPVPLKYTTRWRAVVDIGPDPVTGRRRQRTRTFDTREQAKDWRIKQLHSLRAGVYLEPSEEPLRDYLPRWLASRQGLAHSSRASYRGLIENHLIPHLGAVALGELRPEHIDDLQAALVGQGMAASTVRGVIQLLNQALKRAVVRREILVNPCDAVELVSLPRARPTVWRYEEAERFLIAARSAPLGAAWHLAVLGGLRRGELLALRWGDLDFEHGLIHVRQGVSQDADGHYVISQVKTEAGERIVGLPDSVAALLRRQRAEQNERRLVAGTDWDDTEPDLVFDRGDGARVSFSTYGFHFHRLRERLRLPYIRPHILRHLAATVMIERAKLPSATITALLGHTSYSTTAGIYYHLSPEQARDAAARIEAAFWGQQAG